MLILPLHRKPTLEDLPWVTLSLLVANVLVLVLLQGGDERVEQKAADRYIETGALEREWAWFAEWAEFMGREDVDPERVDHMLATFGEQRQGDYLRLMLIDSEPEFEQAVHAGLLVDIGSKSYLEWQQARSQLEADRQESFTRRYMLRHDEIDPVRAFTHMFMHGGLAHLIGNMLFLCLLGLLLEPALGALRFGLAYLVCGLGAAALSLAVHWGADSGAVGASGAIAGLMGLYALVYGRRRVRFFYWAFVYFDYVKAPALVLLPLWLGWEIISFMLDEGSNIAYEAHIGGIVTGALIGLLLVRTGQVREDWLDSETGEGRLDADRQAVAAAQIALDRLDPGKAKQHLRPLLGRHGRDPQLLSLYLAACQLKAADPDLHDAARRIFELPGDDAAQRDLVAEVLPRYLKATGGRPRIRASTGVELASRLIEWGRLEAGRELLDLLARARRPVPGLERLRRQLADARSSQL